MPPLTKPDRDCERTQTPRATAKGKRGIQVKSRPLGHAQPGKKKEARGDLQPIEYKGQGLAKEGTDVVKNVRNL